MTWTFDGIPFTWLRQTGEGNMSLLPTWKREPNLSIRPYVGDSGATAVEQIGYGPWSLSGQILVSATLHDDLSAKSGIVGTLSDGVLSWQAVASFGLDVVTGDTGAIGVASFTRLL